MSIDFFAKLRGLSIWALQLVLLVSVIGCSITKEWPVYHLYDGDVRPLNKVAVVLADYGVRIEEVDGSWAYDGVPDFFSSSSNYDDTIEYHLIPGRHDIKASYKRIGFERIEKGDPITITHDFSAGTVYKLWSFGPTHWVYGGPNDYGTWLLKVLTKGPVDEVVCTETFDLPKPTGDPLVDFLSILYAPPAHWVELRKQHCPEKVVSPEK